MVRRRARAVSNHEAPDPGLILRDAASRLLRMRVKPILRGEDAAPPAMSAIALTRG
jgi:hypothetical protein